MAIYSAAIDVTITGKITISANAGQRTTIDLSMLSTDLARDIVEAGFEAMVVKHIERTVIAASMQTAAEV